MDLTASQCVICFKNDSNIFFKKVVRVNAFILCVKTAFAHHCLAAVSSTLNKFKSYCSVISPKDTLSVVACKSLPQSALTRGLRSWGRNVNKGGCSFGPGEPRRGRRHIYLDCYSESPTPLSPCQQSRTAQGSTGAAQPIREDNILLIEINTQWRAQWTVHNIIIIV